MEIPHKLNILINHSELKIGALCFNDYSSVEMTKEYFLDVFEIRLEINNDMGIKIKGLAKTIDNIKNTEEKIIISHSVDNGNLLIYTNEEMTKLLGIIDFR